MTLREYLTKQLIDHGVWPDDVPTILARYTELPIGEAMRERLDDDLAVYPPAVPISTWIGVKMAAHDFVAEKTPHAWFLPMLDPDAFPENPPDSA